MKTDAKENSTREHAPQGDKTTGVKLRRLKLGIGDPKMTWGGQEGEEDEIQRGLAVVPCISP